MAQRQTKAFPSTTSPPHTWTVTTQKNQPNSFRHFKQLTLAKVCRHRLADLVAERRSNDHPTADVAKVGVAPGRDALPPIPSSAFTSPGRRERARARARTDMWLHPVSFRIGVVQSVRGCVSPGGRIDARKKNTYSGNVSTPFLSSDGLARTTRRTNAGGHRRRSSARTFCTIRDDSLPEDTRC